MNKIDTKQCKQAIVDFCKQNDQLIIQTAYGDYTRAWIGKTPNSLTEATDPMKKEKNWVRMSKEVLDNKYGDLTQLCLDICRVEDYHNLGPEQKKELTKEVTNKINNNKVYLRGFNCNPYEDQLRAYVWSTDTEILLVTVQGE